MNSYKDEKKSFSRNNNFKKNNGNRRDDRRENKDFHGSRDYKKRDNSDFGKRDNSDYKRTNNSDFAKKDNEPAHDFENQRDDLIIGRNAVREALKADRPCEYLLITKGDTSGSISQLIAMANEKKIPVKQADSKKLDFMCGHSAHQGVILVASAKSYCTLEDILQTAGDKNEEPFVIICDGIEDPHNLGAIIRSAECAGAHGVIVPERRNVGLTYTVGKSSAGALEYMNVARVTNISACIKKLQDAGLWVYCLDMDGVDAGKLDFSGGMAIVVGGEGSGVSPLVKKNCDQVVSIPMKGEINSLNASVAASILMFKAKGLI